MSNWSTVVAEVKALKLADNGRIADELLRRVERNDFVPPSKKKEYREVLLQEYLKS